MSSPSPDGPQTETPEPIETATDVASDRPEQRRPYLVAAIVALMLFRGLNPFANALVSWGQDGCGAQCESWAGLHYLFIGFTGVTAAVSLLVARGLWRGRRWAWVAALVLQAVMFLPVEGFWALAGIGTVIATGLTSATYPATMVVLLLLPGVFRWYWKRDTAA